MDFQPDFIVIGGGSAGAVAAARLSENPSNRVLLLEAGGEADNFLVRMPAGFAQMLTKPRFDWCYEQSADASINNRRFLWSAGKMLGGSSSINGLVYIRPVKADHDRWVAAGCDGWSFEDCLPFFRRSEGFSGGESQFHGSHGPLGVEPMADPHPLTSVFLDACTQAGMPARPDYIDGRAEGSFATLTTQHQSRRSSTSAAFLSEARKRSNLRIVTGAMVDRVQFEGRRATGVEARMRGRRQTWKAGREVIVCAGAIGSPALLMRSGIGPAAVMREHGIAVVADRAEVGRNLQEHPTIAISKQVNVPTYNSQMKPWHLAAGLFRYLTTGKGMMSTPAVQAMGFAHSRGGLEAADLQLHFYPMGYDLEPHMLSAVGAAMPNEPVVTIGASVGNPFSRGEVRLTGPSATDRPTILHQILGDDRDLQTLLGACRLIERIFGSPAFEPFLVGNRSPARVPQDDTGWINHIRSKTMISYHPAGTCRMGSDTRAIVTPQLAVQGVHGLRVADASVIPLLPRVNTNATAIMVGERVAEWAAG